MCLRSGWRGWGSVQYGTDVCSVGGGHDTPTYLPLSTTGGENAMPRQMKEKERVPLCRYLTLLVLQLVCMSFCAFSTVLPLPLAIPFHSFTLYASPSLSFRSCICVVPPLAKCASSRSLRCNRKKMKDCNTRPFRFN